LVHKCQISDKKAMRERAERVARMFHIELWRAVFRYVTCLLTDYDMNRIDTKYHTC